jgi:hypothetical protein
MADLATSERRAWSAVAAATGAAYRGTALVRGPGATQVGEALLALGASTVIAEDTLVEDPAADPPEDTLDTVILLHAWPGPHRVDDAARAATGWLRPGGWLVLADLDMDQLRAAPPNRYPSAALYRMFPETGAKLQRRSATMIGLVTAAIRAGLEGKTSVGVDRPVGVYASPSELRAAIEFGVWRGLEDLAGGDYAAVVDSVEALNIGPWPIVELEPWVVVAGMSRV